MEIDNAGHPLERGYSVFRLRSIQSECEQFDEAGDPMKQAGSDIADPKRRTLEVFDNE
jgi:hypothetical protein